MDEREDPADTEEIALVGTGIAGLDEVLHGGLPIGALCLVEGTAGTGKTTLGLQFALEGVRQGESVLYVTLAESQGELERVARSHGWDLAQVHILEKGRLPERPSTLFHPSEVELDEFMTRLKDRIREIAPARIVVDSLTEIRLMAEGTLRYRREIMELKRSLASCRCTILLLEEYSLESSLRTFADGAILLEQVMSDYGAQRRRLSVVKVRGSDYAGGFHDFLIRKGGLEVFPRLPAAEPRPLQRLEVVSSGIDSLDALLGGGPTKGSSTLIVGPAGTGKSSIALQFAVHAARRGGQAAVYLFEERPETALARAAGLHMDAQPLLENGRLHLQRMDPTELSAGQFAHLLRQEVDVYKVSVLVIDSLNGYLQAIPERRSLLAQVHELLTYLGRHDICTFLIMGQAGTVGETLSPTDTSYLTDNVLLLRFFESAGAVHKAISVVKKRSGPHETTIHELEFGPDGIRIGEVLRQFQGILGGRPFFTRSAGR